MEQVYQEAPCLISSFSCTKGFHELEGEAVWVENMYITDECFSQVCYLVFLEGTVIYDPDQNDGCTQKG